MSPKTAMLSRTYSWRGAGRSRFRSMIWERSKRKDTRLKAIGQRKIRHMPQASAGQLTPRVLPFRLSSKSFQVACSVPPLSTKGIRNRRCFLRASSQKAPPPQTNAGFRKEAKGERYWRQPKLYRPLSSYSSSFITFRFQYYSFSPAALPPHPLLKSCICREDSSRSAQAEKTAERLFERLSARVCG